MDRSRSDDSKRCAHFIKNRFSEDQLERHIQTTEGDDSPLLVSAKGGDSIAR